MAKLSNLGFRRPAATPVFPERPSERSTEEKNERPRSARASATSPKRHQGAGADEIDEFRIFTLRSEFPHVSADVIQDVLRRFFHFFLKCFCFFFKFIGLYIFSVRLWKF